MNEKLTDMLVAFVQRPQWSKEAVEPENNPEWRAGYEAAQDNLREKLRPWWPLGGPLNLAMPDNPIPSSPPVEEVERVARALLSVGVTGPNLRRKAALAVLNALRPELPPSDYCGIVQVDPADFERPELPHDVEIDGLIERLSETAKYIRTFSGLTTVGDEIDEAATALEALKGRVEVLEAAAQALIDDVRRRYPNEELRCEYLRKIDALLNSKADTALQSKERN